MTIALMDLSDGSIKEDIKRLIIPAATTDARDVYSTNVY
jgi:hypothetical protein